MSTANPSRARREDIYSAGQLSRLLGVSPKTIATWIDTGQLPGWRVTASATAHGGHRRVKRSVLEAFMRERGFPLSLLSDPSPAIK